MGLVHFCLLSCYVSKTLSFLLNFVWFVVCLFFGDKATCQLLSQKIKAGSSESNILLLQFFLQDIWVLSIVFTFRRTLSFDRYTMEYVFARDT